MGELTEAELARRAGTSQEAVRRLAGFGVLSSEEPPFRDSDILRLRFVESFERAGIGAADVGQAVAAGHFSFNSADVLYAAGSELSSKTYATAWAESGLPVTMSQVIHRAFGLPVPRPEDFVPEDELQLIPLQAAFTRMLGSEATLTREFRVWGENIRRIAEADVENFDRDIAQPMLATGMAEQEALDAAIGIWSEIREQVYRALVWLYRQHLDHYIMATATEYLERAMEQAGLFPKRNRETPAIAFLDLAGFTQLTEERGDHAAAELAINLTEVAEETSHLYGGKPVKLLGDGVMFHFPQVSPAVSCALDLVDAAPRAGLPPARVGVHAGPVVFQNGDYFGRAVNVAARIADAAAPGEVLVSDDVVALASDGVGFVQVGPVPLKGLAEPVSLFRATRN
ncbi:MAG TPA: adenylate/guanylate cyclase domain-containing protein [Actinomycetota bacterium]|nr:adenylate/guanylate cyclase domain-containing protein [Actinomycetota bacterium]